MENVLDMGNQILLIKVTDGKYKRFYSSLEKELFIRQHDQRGYEMHDNYVIIHMYMVIDTQGYGWNLTKANAVTFEEAQQLIKMYL